MSDTAPKPPTPGEIEAAMKALQQRLNAYIRGMPTAKPTDPTSESLSLRLPAMLAEMDCLVALMRSAQGQKRPGHGIFMPAAPKLS